MNPKKKEGNINLIIDILILIFITPLIISKILGDGIISFIKSSYFFINKTYKIFLGLLNAVKKLIIKFFKILINILFLIFKQHKKIIIGKKGTIYTKKKRLSLRFHLPKISVFNFVRLPQKYSQRHWFTSGKLLLIKLKFLFLGLLIAIIFASYYLVTISVSSLPNPAQLTQRDIPSTTKIYDAMKNV